MSTRASFKLVSGNAESFENHLAAFGQGFPTDFKK